MKQSQAVINAIMSVLKLKEIENNFVRVHKDSDERKKIIDILEHGLRNGEIEMTDKSRAKYGKVKDGKDGFRGYASSLLSHNLKRNLKLNGGVKWTPDNPGSRTGSTDPQIKNLKILLTTPEIAESEERTAMVEAQIEKRTKELAAAKQVQPDLSCLDPDFLAKLKLDGEAES